MKIVIGKQYKIKQNDGTIVIGEITNVESDIKNGRSGVDYTVIGGVDAGDECWAYSTQIIGESTIPV